MPGCTPIVVDVAGLMELPPRHGFMRCRKYDMSRREIRSRAKAGPWGWLVTRHATHTVMAVRRARLTLLDVHSALYGLGDRTRACTKRSCMQCILSFRFLYDTLFRAFSPPKVHRPSDASARCNCDVVHGVATRVAIVDGAGEFRRGAAPFLRRDPRRPPHGGAAFGAQTQLIAQTQLVAGDFSRH